VAKQRGKSARFIDPEEERWRKTYPKFPGVAKCVELLRSPNVFGTWTDIISEELVAHAPQIAQELFAAFHDEPDAWVKMILLSVIAEARLPEAMPILLEHLGSEDTSLRRYAITGLKNLGTKEARTALWAAGAV